MNTRFLGIDFGKKRVGVAISSEDNALAFPLTVIPNSKKLLGEIRTLVAEHNIASLVLGESKDFQGKPNKIMSQILAFKDDLEKELGLPVYLEPEFMTSEQARRTVGETAMHDASAAALILQSYLDKNKKND